MKTIEEYTKYAKDNNWTLSKYAQVIIDRVKLCEGQCPCKTDSDKDETCPCPDHKEEIETNGKCKCNLFNKSL